MEILEKLKRVKVLVVGDVMLDRYWWGEVTRISPEAPVPVVKLKNSSLAAGGAANVAANIAGLGAIPILIGCVGDDSEAALFSEVFSRSRISSAHLIRLEGRPTTVKTRVIAHSQQVTRIDQESNDPLEASQEDSVLKKLLDTIGEVDAVAISDYAKGMLTRRILREIVSLAKEHGKPIIVDPKGKDYTKYRGATLLTPNRREAAEACNMEDDGKRVVGHAGRRLIREMEVRAVLITEGEEGMTLFQEGIEPIHMSALARKVYDVTGAGDTVIGVLATAVGAGADLAEAAHLANIAAGLVVEKVGTSAVSLDELSHAVVAGASFYESGA